MARERRKARGKGPWRPPVRFPDTPPGKPSRTICDEISVASFRGADLYSFVRNDPVIPPSSRHGNGAIRELRLRASDTPNQPARGAPVVKSRRWVEAGSDDDGRGARGKPDAANDAAADAAARCLRAGGGSGRGRVVRAAQGGRCRGADAGRGERRGAGDGTGALRAHRQPARHRHHRAGRAAPVLRGHRHRGEDQRRRVSSDAGLLALCRPGHHHLRPFRRTGEAGRQAVLAPGQRDGPGAERFPRGTERAQQVALAALLRDQHREAPARSLRFPRHHAEGIADGAERPRHRAERRQDGGGRPGGGA